MRKIRHVIGLALGILIVSGCNKSEEPQPKVESAQQQQAPTTTVERKNELSQSEKDTYMKSAREEIEQLRGQIDALTEKAKTSSAELKVEMEKKIQGFRDELQELDKKWEASKDVGADTWQDFKRTMDESIKKLRNAIGRENT